MDPFVLMLFVSLTALSGQLQASSPAAGVLAHNVRVEPGLRDVMADAFAASPTLRELARALGEYELLLVNVSIDPDLAGDRACRAQGELRRYSSGVRIARIRLPGRRDASELVAHELEHVKEWVEGVNLARAYAERRPGVFRLGDGRFETARARAVGLRVKDEVEAYRPLLTTSRVTR